MDIAFAAILLLAAVALWWLSAVNARERAREAARAFCLRNRWQLLDQTVALRWLRPIRDGERWCLHRRYRFEFSPDGGRRFRGEVQFNGARVARILAELEDGQMIEEQ